MSERSLFLAALDIEDPAERSAYLDRACAADTLLRSQVEQLLQAHQAPGPFMERLAPAALSTLDEPVPDRPGVVIGPYKLLEQIGEGGFGIVYLAEQQQPLRRRVALKVLKPGMDSHQVIARFEAERQALALMDHPNIARVLDGGQNNGRPYFVMDLVKGRPITDYCDQACLSIRERLGLFVQVCRAVQHAHQKGIIHRDLKPSNVLVTLRDGGPLAKVIDFGIAKALGQELTDKTVCTGLAQLLGTPPYMAPEQAALSNVDVDTRSDVYSLGVLLYELLTGTTPFARERLSQVGYDELRRIIQEEEPPRPSARISTPGHAATVSMQRKSDAKRLSQLCRGDLDWIVMKCLEKDRNRRYETVGVLARDVEHYLADEAVEACPPAVGYRLRKLVRRNQRLVLAAGLVLLALIAGVIGTTVGLLRARSAARAERSAKEAEAGQRRRAEDNATLAMAVLDEIILKEARRRLTPYAPDEAKASATNPDQKKLEPAFLEKGLRFYERLAQTNATSWAARRQRAKAYANVGLLRLELHDDTGSETAYRQAVLLMEKLAGERPGDFDNAFDLADANYCSYRLYWDSGRLQQAEEVSRRGVALFAKLAANFPDRRPLALLHKAACQELLVSALRKAGKRREAEQALEQCVGTQSELVAADPKAARSRLFLAFDYGSLGDLLHETGQVPKAIGAWQQASLVLKTLVADTGDPAARSALAGYQDRLGRALEKTGWPQEAEKCYRAALSVEEALAAQLNTPHHHQSVGFWADNLGNFLQRTGQPAEAAKAYRKALAAWEKLAGEHPAEHSYRQRQALTCSSLGRALKDTGRVQDAEKAYRRAVAIEEALVAESPTYPAYRWPLSGYLGALAENLLEQRKHAEAAQVAGKIPGALPRDANGYQRAALVLARCRELASMDARLSETGRKAAAHAYAARAREWVKEAARHGFNTPAAGELPEALALPPGHPQARYHLGVALEEMAYYAAAEAEFRAALRLRPDFAEAHAKLGDALWTQRRNAEAEAECREALRLRPGDPEACYTLGLVYRAQKRPAAGARFYAEAFAAHPKLADDLRFPIRYNAACCAAAAGCGRGKDAAGLDNAGRARLRRQALDWLRADLTAWHRLLEKPEDQAQARVLRWLRIWQQDGDLVGVRGEALLKLPEAERHSWQHLWADVEKTSKKASRNVAVDAKGKPPHIRPTCP